MRAPLARAMARRIAPATRKRTAESAIGGAFVTPTFEAIQPPDQVSATTPISTQSRRLTARVSHTIACGDATDRLRHRRVAGTDRRGLHVRQRAHLRPVGRR